MIDFKGSQFEKGIILWGIRWYVAYPISYRQLEEMMKERGVEVDHSSLNRWVLKYAPELEKAFCQRRRPVGTSWRMDETYISVKGQWKYLYRAVDKSGDTVDFLLTAKRDRKAAMRFLRKAIKQNGTPAKITIDKSGANAAAVNGYKAEAQIQRNLSDLYRCIKRLESLTWDVDAMKEGEAKAKLSAKLDDCLNYLDSNRAVIVNYGDRFRHGDPIATGFVESAVNQVVAKLTLLPSYSQA